MTRSSVFTEADREALACRGIIMPPTQDELPFDDGIPMDSEQQALQMDLLFETLRLHWADRDDVHVGKNQFLYFSTGQLLTQDFLGPDVYVVLDVPRRIRKSWVIWEEGKAPDVVIEILSPTTSARDKGDKKRIYQDKVRALEYFWYDPLTSERAGFALVNGVYLAIEPDEHDRLISGRLGLALVRWEGSYQGTPWTWLRWATVDGALLPTSGERAEEEHQRAEEERQRADTERQRVAELEAQLARYRERFGEPPT
jgi:Uma2 family endonuclease